jgi:hypothetical protein
MVIAESRKPLNKAGYFTISEGLQLKNFKTGNQSVEMGVMAIRPGDFTRSCHEIREAEQSFAFARFSCGSLLSFPMSLPLSDIAKGIKAESRRDRGVT